MKSIQVKKYANAIFQYNIFSIGGVECFIWETCNKYKDLDIDVFYVDGDENQVKRLRNIIGFEHVHKYSGEIIHCEKAILSWDIGALINNIFADEIIQFQHADWSQKIYKIKPSVHEKIDTYLAVSDVANKGFKLATNNQYKVKTCYPPITIRPEETRRVLTFVSACRLSEEKGKDRIITFINELNRANIPYYYHIFTSDTNQIALPNVYYHSPCLNIRPYLKNADYVVQLSDTESYCYTLVESLCLGTPVICTDMPVLKEIGVKERVNGFVLPFDMKNIPIQEIYEKELKFTYTPRKDELEKYLTKGKTKTISEGIMRVKIIKEVFDSVAKVHYVNVNMMGNEIAADGYPNKPVGTIVELEEARAKRVVDSGYGIYVDEVKRTKSKKKVK